MGDVTFFWPFNRTLLLGNILTSFILGYPMTIFNYSSDFYFNGFVSCNCWLSKNEILVYLKRGLKLQKN
jgi:hypothetical protein